MTESSELASAQKHTDNPARVILPTTEGYQPLIAEQTEFSLAKNQTGCMSLKSSLMNRQAVDLQSKAVPSKQMLHSDNIEMEPETMETKSVTDYFNKMQMGSLVYACKRKNKPDAEMKTHFDVNVTVKKQAGKRTENDGELKGKLEMHPSKDCQHLSNYNLERTAFRKDNQRWYNTTDKNTSDRLPSGTAYSKTLPRLSNLANSKNESNSKDDINIDTVLSEQEDIFISNANFISSSKELGESEADDTSADNISKLADTDQSINRICEYHIAKNMSSLQSEGHFSLQSSQCSSLDAGCSTGSSSCATPVESPLCTSDVKHILSDTPVKSGNYISPDERQSILPNHGASYPELHQQGDTSCLRISVSSHTSVNADPLFGTLRDGSHRISKIKETTV